MKSIPIEHALDFAEYFRSNFDYYDNTVNGNIYKKKGEQAMTMLDIFENWYKKYNHENIHRNLHRQ